MSLKDVFLLLKNPLLNNVKLNAKTSAQHNVGATVAIILFLVLCFAIYSSLRLKTLAAISL